MIKANELRIGNWYNHFLSPKQVLPKTIEKIWQAENIGNDSIGISAIQLTEAWMHRFGFTVIKLKSRKEWFISFKSFTIECDVFSICFTEDKFYFNSLDVSGSENMTEIKHVHQLQNLYFALTGEELSVK